MCGLFLVVVARVQTRCPTAVVPWPQNDFIAILSARLKKALQGEPGVYYLQTAEWTRGLGHDLGRHKCAPADPAGVHFATGTANMAHLQQVWPG